MRQHFRRKPMTCAQHKQHGPLVKASPHLREGQGGAFFPSFFVQFRAGAGPNHKRGHAAGFRQRLHDVLKGFRGAHKAEGFGAIRVGCRSVAFEPVSQKFLQQTALILQRRGHKKTPESIGAGNPCYIVNIKVCQRTCAADFMLQQHRMM